MRTFVLQHGLGSSHLNLCQNRFDDPSRFVVVQPDPDTGELVPQLHRGKKRLIEKAQNGMWRPVKG